MSSHTGKVLPTSMQEIAVDQGRARGLSAERIAELVGVSEAMVWERFTEADAIAAGLRDRLEPTNVVDIADARLARDLTKSLAAELEQAIKRHPATQRCQLCGNPLIHNDHDDICSACYGLGLVDADADNTYQANKDMNI
jgi:predicted transcriptional regulator